ncbi:MAG: glycosyltransferase family 4 protein [Bacteroidales bacterium]|nr:glycosyltransferase family 4 protein [Bacteroidales bacterium]
MKKVICFINSLGAGGAQRQLVGLAIFLKEKGYDVRVAVYHGDSFYVNELQKCEVPYFYWKDAANPFRRLYKIARHIRKENPDVVISYIETPNICACVAKLFNKSFRLIVSERSSTLKTGIKERIRFNLYRFADIVLPNSYSQGRYIKQTFPFLASKTVTVPNFVDLSLFTPQPGRTRRSIPEIIVVASISERKNTIGLIEAIAHLKNEGCRFHFSWYGLNSENNTYIDRCYDYIESLHIDDCIVLKEKTIHIREQYQTADFFCLPSFYEGTPNVICEAMACGLPVICSDVCDNSRYVESGKNGFLFDPNNLDTMVDAFKKLFSLDDDDYYRFSQHSRAIAEHTFSKDRFVDSYVALIENRL